MSPTVIASSSTSPAASSSRVRPAVSVFGALLGAVLHGVGFTDGARVHAMFTFAELELIGVFGVAVVVVGVGLRFLSVTPSLPPRTWHRGLVPGAILFGLGWALSGACPGAVIAMAGEGQWLGVVGVVGVVVGAALTRRVVHAAAR
jgi:uncharacterized membrane protein YedE/YeeE